MPRQRIVIYGVTGSGKTTLGKRLARDLSLTHIELDALYHGPGWTPTPPDQFQAKVQAALDASPQGWVADGNYGAAREVLLPRADTVVWLRLPWRVSYLRMLRRTFGRALTRKELWNGNKESLKLMFFDKESLLLWGIREHKPSQQRVGNALAEIPHAAELFEPRSTREVEALVRRLIQERSSEAAVPNASSLGPP